MKFSRSRWLRILVGIGAPLLALGGLFYLYRYGSPFVCVFYAFFLLAFPFVAYYLIKQYIRFVFRKDPLPFFQIGLSAYNGIMLLVLLFWVLRNIPVFPFSLLAP